MANTPTKSAATAPRVIRVPAPRSDVRRFTPDDIVSLNRESSESSVALFHRVTPFDVAAVTASSVVGRRDQEDARDAVVSLRHNSALHRITTDHSAPAPQMHDRAPFRIGEEQIANISFGTETGDSVALTRKEMLDEGGELAVPSWHRRRPYRHAGMLHIP